jgi:hypothetical protein
MKTMVLPIKGKDWKINFVTEREFQKRNPQDIAPEDRMYPAITSPDKYIDFIKSEFNLGLAFHELLHAYQFECNTGSSNLSADQAQEQDCEILENHHDDLFVQSHKILEFFLKEAN